MQALLEAAIQSKLSALGADVRKFLLAADAARASALVVQFEAEHPQLAPIVRTLFRGTPREFQERVGAVLPWVYDVPLEVIARFQCALINEWERAR